MTISSATSCNTTTNNNISESLIKLAHQHRPCYYCKKINSLKYCFHCQLIGYCSEICQHTDRDNHILICGTIIGNSRLFTADNNR